MKICGSNFDSYKSRDKWNTAFLYQKWYFNNLKKKTKRKEEIQKEDEYSDSEPTDFY